MAGMPGATSGPVPILRMYGVTMDGHSVLAHVHGFHPYFFVQAPNNFQPSHCTDFRVCFLGCIFITSYPCGNILSHAVYFAAVLEFQSLS